MSLTDNERIELIERQIAEKVTVRVRSELFKFYAAIGLSVGVALTYVGWDFKSNVAAQIGDAIAKDVEEKREIIQEQTTESRILAKNANEIIQQTKKLLTDFQPEADNLKVTIDRVNSINRAAQDLSDSYAREIQPILMAVESLSNQVNTLAKQVEQLNALTAESEASVKSITLASAEQRASVLENVIEQSKETEQRIDEARKKTTVFLQFSVGTRSQAKALSELLSKDEFILFEPDRTEAALGKYEVRYFYEEDKAAAQRLADKTNIVLEQLGNSTDLSTKVEVESFVEFNGKKPRTGVLELWLQLPITSDESDKV